MLPSILQTKQSHVSFVMRQDTKTSFDLQAHLQGSSRPQILNPRPSVLPGLAFDQGAIKPCNVAIRIILSQASFYLPPVTPRARVNESHRAL